MVLVRLSDGCCCHRRLANAGYIVTDLEREQAIERLYQVLVGNEIPEVKRAAFAKMRELIEGRSPEQVQKMEVKRGLRAS